MTPTQRTLDYDYTEFRYVVGAAIARGLRRAIATEFEIAESTASRWANGWSRPHPFIAAQVVGWLKEQP